MGNSKFKNSFYRSSSLISLNFPFVLILAVNNSHSEYKRKEMFIFSLNVTYYLEIIIIYIIQKLFTKSVTITD